MAMTAWSAKVFTSSICLSVKGRTSTLCNVITPMTVASRSMGTARTVRTSAPSLRPSGTRDRPWRRGCGRRGARGGRGPSRLSIGPVGCRLQDLDGLGGLPVGRGHRDRGRHPAIDGPSVGVAEPGRALEEALQHGLEVERRAADDLQDLAGRGLLFERLGEVPVAGLELLEQPDVLDGDDGLVGEGLEQLDLLVRERPGLGASDGDRADGLALHGAWGRRECFDSPGLRRGEGRRGTPGRLESRTSTTVRSRIAVATWVSRLGAIGYARRRLEPLVRPVVVSDEVNQVAVEPDTRH